MGRFQEDLNSQNQWLHELARAEVHPEAERLLELGSSYDPQQLVEESAVEFLSEVRQVFSEFARVFNAYSEAGSKFQEVKIYGVAQSASDFMLYRNQLKLIVSNPSQGLIQISFSQHQRGVLAVDGQNHGNDDAVRLSSASSAQEILAQIGPFRDVYWTYQGEKVEPAQLAKFHFVEFIRLSRDKKRLRRGNQVLIDQIKALLEQKGLDL